MRTKIVLITAVAASFFSMGAMADIIYKCTMGANERTISVVYSNPASKTPCEVNYAKDGEVKTLWSYQNESGNCESQAAAFVEKQKGWGWQCSEQSAENTSTSPNQSLSDTAPAQ